jgi:general secretion pathway protein E
VDGSLNSLLFEPGPLEKISVPSLKEGVNPVFLFNQWCKNHKLAAFDLEGQTFILCTKPEEQMFFVSELAEQLENSAVLKVASESQIMAILGELRTQLMSTLSLNTLEESSVEEIEMGQIKFDVTEAGTDDAPIVRYVNSLIFRASQQNASDIHIEPFEDHVKIRFRRDGVLFDVSRESISFSSAIISRIKILAGMNVSERRLPQDGRIGVVVGGRPLDLRVSCVPTQFGERVVLRLLDKSASLLQLEDLGLEGENLAILLKLIYKPNGIILVTGPTGSGKTTTLYACLSKINRQEINILTVEDPIEYQIPGIGQMQVNPRIGFTFAAGLRSILRQDPDVVMVGEIRDAETAEIAIQASLTGHLVFSTLHTNDAPSAISRLIDLGIEPFLVSSSVLCILGQRLVRRLCNHCKVPYEISNTELKSLGLNTQLSSAIAFKPGDKDCRFCNNVRYVGRIGIHELLVIKDNIRGLILSKADSKTIKQVAEKENNFKSLRVDGLAKVLQGITSVEEVLLATHDE